VPGVASGVAGSIDERPLLGRGVPAAGKVMNVPGDFVKELHHVDGVSRGAFTVVESGQISNVRGMVGRVQVLAIPACGHVDPSIESTLAIGGGESVSIVARGSSVAEARPEDGTLGKFALRTLSDSVLLATLPGVTRDHLQASGESLETRATIVGISVTTVLIVDEETTVGDRFEFLGAGVLEVELGEPVIRKILLDQATRAGRLSERIKSGVGSETIGSMDCVDVVGRAHARTDDGVNTLLDEGTRASDTEPGVCS
jgi:hypothetical protein